MDIEKLINLIEIPAYRSMDWYYHAFKNNEEVFIDIMTEGLKCRKLLNQTERKNTGHNGLYFISLGKNIDNQFGSYYVNLMDKPSLIIDGISPIKCKGYYLYSIFHNTKIKLRSGHKDEYQAFQKINPENIVGLQCSVYKWLLDDYYDIYRDYLTKLKKYIFIMRYLNIDLPIYDYSRRDGMLVHEINSDAYLKLYNEILDINSKVPKLVRSYK